MERHNAAKLTESVQLLPEQVSRDGRNELVPWNVPECDPVVQNHETYAPRSMDNVQSLTEVPSSPDAT
jgi:hypothetical protein